jgi:hypothetical protein
MPLPPPPVTTIAPAEPQNSEIPEGLMNYQVYTKFINILSSL